MVNGVCDGIMCVRFWFNVIMWRWIWSGRRYAGSDRRGRECIWCWVWFCECVLFWLGLFKDFFCFRGVLSCCCNWLRGCRFWFWCANRRGRVDKMFWLCLGFVLWDWLSGWGCCWCWICIFGLKFVWCGIWWSRRWSSLRRDWTFREVCSRTN